MVPSPAGDRAAPRHAYRATAPEELLPPIRLPSPASSSRRSTDQLSLSLPPMPPHSPAVSGPLSQLSHSRILVGLSPPAAQVSGEVALVVVRGSTRPQTEIKKCISRATSLQVQTSKQSNISTGSGLGAKQRFYSFRIKSRATSLQVQASKQSSISTGSDFRGVAMFRVDDKNSVYVCSGVAMFKN